MRGQIISKEYQNISWVRDEDGREYACYAADLSHSDKLTDAEKEKCTDLSLVPGDSW